MFGFSWNIEFLCFSTAMAKFCWTGYNEDLDQEEETKDTKGKGKVKDEPEEEDVKVPDSKLDPSIQGLMELIFNQQ
jgi:hypothetical protein